MFLFQFSFLGNKCSNNRKVTFVDRYLLSPCFLSLLTQTNPERREEIQDKMKKLREKSREKVMKVSEEEQLLDQCYVPVLFNTHKPCQYVMYICIIEVCRGPTVHFSPGGS